MSSTPAPARPRRKSIDLDAGRREAAYPDGLDVTMSGHVWELPAELPLETFDPFLSEDFDLVQLILDYADARYVERNGEMVEADLMDVVVALLTRHPSVVRDTMDALHGAFAALFGEEQYAQFRATRPSIPAYGRLIAYLASEYGVSLGEAFASPGSSESGGATPKQSAEEPSASTSETPSSDETTSD